jgi:SAM-dependent methyltransferase
MTDDVPRPPRGFDPERPSPARMYDCFLGGTHNFASDRAAVAQAIAVLPKLPEMMRANRAFLQRAVRLAAGSGIDQFIDLGSGIPTAGNVHEVARAENPDAKVVYVDIDPVAVLHSQAILGDDRNTVVLQADLREPKRIMDAPAVRALIDLDRPVCLLIVAVLHFVADSPALEHALEFYRDTLAPGSFLVISHGTDEGRLTENVELGRLYARTGTPLVPRRSAELRRLIGDWAPVDPGIVYTPQWRPDDSRAVDRPADFSTLALVARKVR